MRAVHRASRATGHSAFPAARWGRRGKRGVVRSAEAGVPAGQLARVAHPIGRRHAREAATSRRHGVDDRRDDVPRPAPPASVAYFGIGAHRVSPVDARDASIAACGRVRARRCDVLCDDGIESCQILPSAIQRACRYASSRASTPGQGSRSQGGAETATRRNFLEHEQTRFDQVCCERMTQK